MSFTRVSTLCGLMICTGAGLGWAQLDPPPGPVMPTMKPLNQVEPRIPISELPFTISEPGSYYLTQNLTLTADDVDGITVEASGVTLDLNGFHLIGTGQGIGNGVVTIDSVRNTVIRNGTVQDWGGRGVLMLHDAVCERLNAIGNSIEGIRAGAGSRVLECEADNNGFVGIACDVGSRIENSFAGNNGTDGISTGGPGIVRNCLATNNGNNGILIAGETSITDNVCSGNGGSGISQSTGRGALIKNNVCSLNLAHGISTTGAHILENQVRANDVNGILLHAGFNNVQRNFAVNNGTGIAVIAAEISGGYVASNVATGNATSYSLGTSTVGTGDNVNIAF